MFYGLQTECFTTPHQSRFLQPNKMGRLRQTTEEIQNILDEAEGLRPIVEQNAEAMATLNGDGDGSVESRAEKKIKDNTDSALSTESENPVMNKVITVALNEKVDKVSGKGLSTNDYTTSEKDKLASLENYNDSEIKSQLTELSAEVGVFEGTYIGNVEIFNKEVVPQGNVISIKMTLRASAAALQVKDADGKVLENFLVKDATIGDVVDFGTYELPQNYEKIVNLEGYSGTRGVDVQIKVLGASTPQIKHQIEAIESEVKEGIRNLESEVNQQGDEVDSLKELCLAREVGVELVPTIDYTQDGYNGYWKKDKGDFYKDDSRRATNKIAVKEGQTYLISTYLRPATIPALMYYGLDGSYLGFWHSGTGVEEYLVDEPFVVEQGIGYIAVNSASKESPIVKVIQDREVKAFYSKDESNELFASKYGVCWSLSDFNDLGQRCFSAKGLSAEIAIGNTNGHSDFDNIFPWSEMKRCNLRVTENGAKIVTYEGEDGFALDGSNGDVFVRIPKFKTNRYTQDGKMYVVIGEGYTHPAFVESGKEVDEIFVGAYEASKKNDALYSCEGVIPANNEIGSAFLAAAKARGNGYSLFDMRAIDAIWRLMAVEYGCRNSNRIIGYGYSDYRQAAEGYSFLFAKYAATSTNQITLAATNDNSLRAIFMTEFAVGNNILFCEGNQNNILAQRKITNIVCPTSADDIVISFDGTPINITTSTFVGNAPCDCGYCNIAWHTGRTDIQPMANSKKPVEAINPCRYRWIENIVGNVWHFLPDVLFKDRQMYVCADMENYSMDFSLANYTPIGDALPLQSSNGNKSDVNAAATPNFWMTKMLNDTFAKGSAFGKEYDTEHNGLLSAMGFGGYYYLNNGNNLVVHGGGFDHLWRSNVLTFRGQIAANQRWFLYGARLMYKNTNL